MSERTGLSFDVVDTGQIDDMADNMHQVDIAEINAVMLPSMRDPREVLADAIASADFAVGGFDAFGRMVMVFGVTPVSLTSDIGRPWLLRHRDAPRFRRAYVADSSRYIALMAERYRLLENYVSAENNESIRWLKRNGFTIEQPLPVGLNGEMLSRFYRGSTDVCSSVNDRGRGGKRGVDLPTV